MSSVPEATLAQLLKLAFEAREVFGERGYHIDVALHQDRAFRTSGVPRSALIRALVIDAVKVGASRHGVWFEIVKGGAVELRFETVTGYQIFRLKTARRDANGEVIVLANQASSWGNIDEETLISEEPWVLGYIASADGISDLFVAEVRGIEDGAPGRLILGPEISLGGSPDLEQRGFRSEIDDSLPGFDEDEQEEQEDGFGLSD